MDINSPSDSVVQHISYIYIYIYIYINYVLIIARSKTKL